MADTTLVTPINGSETIPPQVKNTKNPPGRPRKDGLPAGTTKEVDAELDIQEFFAQLKPLSDDWWNRHVLYLYRQYPITDRRSAGKLLWIDKFSEPVDQEKIMQLHGSGTYRLDLLHEGNKRIGTTSFRILNMDYPPKVPAGDWVDDPKNKDWEWCRPKLGPQAVGIPQTGITSTELLNTMLRFKEATDRPEPKDSAAELLQTLLDSPVIAALIPKPAPPAEPKEDKSLALLLQMLMDDRKAMREEMIESRKQANSAQPQKSWIETAIENEELMRRLFGKGNGPSGPQLDGWAAVIDKGLDKIGGGLTAIAPIIAQRLLMPQPQQRPATVVQATAQPQPLPAPEPVQVQPQPEAAPQEAPQDVNQLQLFQKYGQVIQQALPFMIDQFKEDEPDGYGCRDWFCSPKRFGNVVWEGLRNDVGVEQFITVAKGIPQVWQAFQPEEKFRAFLTDFFTPVGQERGDYFEEDFEDQPDEDETRPGAKTNAGK